MSKKITTAIAAAMIGGTLTAATLPAHAASAPKMQKCYGVVKAGKNDCGTKAHSCAGLAKTNGAADEWILLPKGACDKIVGGKLKD